MLDLGMALKTISLHPEWMQLLQDYKLQHQHPKNQWTHSIGIPMILASLPLMISIVGLPLGATLFTVGWGFQFWGHKIEGNDPAFFGDKRNLIIGALWWAEKKGVVKLIETQD